MRAGTCGFNHESAQSISAFIIHQLRGKFACARGRREEKPLAWHASQNAAFGVLWRAVWLLSLRALACAGPHRHVLAVCRERAGV